MEKKLVLKEWESKELKKDGAVEITRNGFDILVELDFDGDHRITIINPYDKVITKKEKTAKKETVKILASIFDPKKMHVYDVKTTGKRPVRLIDGGYYITEYEGKVSEVADCGWFYLNQKEYDYYKSQLKMVEVEVD